MKSKVFRICLCIALCIALFTGTFAFMGWGSLLRQVGGGLLYPFRWTADKIATAAEGFSHYFQDIRELEQENDRLREENESLRAGLLDAEIIADENSWLYRYLDMKQEREDWTLCEARVLATEYASGEDGATYAVLLTLNKGSSSGLVAGMPVVTERGLVGILYEVSLDSCKVRTLLHTDFAAGAADSGTAETGLWEGSFSTLPSGRATVTGLPIESEVATGDVILTSGEGSIYPYGIPLGRVVEVSVDAYERSTVAEVVPFVDMTDVREVMVLTGYTHYTDSSFRSGTDGQGGGS